MMQNGEPQRRIAYSQYPMVPQNFHSANMSGGLEPHSPTHPQNQNHTQFSQQQQQTQPVNNHFDNMPYSNMHPGQMPGHQFPYMPQWSASLPPFNLAHGINPEAQYFQQPYPPQYFLNGAWISHYPSHPSTNFANQQPQYMVPSPVASYPSPSPYFKQYYQGPTSPSTTVLSTPSKRSNRKSPVIAITPIQDSSCFFEEFMDMMSPSSSNFEDGPRGFNVYIKGVEASMTDKKLRAIAEPFGTIISSKAIIDRPSGVCKGYCFVRFGVKDDADKFMVELKEKYKYDAAIAKDSFYSRLKDLGDSNSTNLYVSNLPTSWNEEKILAIFNHYEVAKCRILTGSRGINRGVAFMTFKDRDVCDEIIETFNGLDLKEPGHHLSLQVRYADTVAQKQFKKDQQKEGKFPKKSVLANHAQVMKAAAQVIAGPGGTVPRNPRESPSAYARSRVWRNNAATLTEVVKANVVNAPPTPPQSVISAEDEGNVKQE